MPPLPRNFSLLFPHLPFPYSLTFLPPPPTPSPSSPPPTFFPLPPLTLPHRWDTTILVDESRTLYRQWGLPESASWLPAGGPLYLVHAYRLGKEEGIWGTGPIEGDTTGTRAQMGGAFAVDAGGVVRWYGLCLPPLFFGGG